MLHDEQYNKGAVAFWGDVVVHRAVLLGGGRLCNGQRAHGQWHLGGCCGVSGGVVGGEAAMRRTRHGGGDRGEKLVRWTTRVLLVVAFRDNVAVRRGVLSGERRQCNGQRGGMQRCVCILFAHGHRQDPLEEGEGSHY